MVVVKTMMANQTRQPMPGDRLGFRPTPAARHGCAFRSIRMPYHASGWFDRLREADYDAATQEATTTGALSGHGQGAPRISRIATDIRGRLRRVLSVPIRVIRGQNQSGSNQALEPMETRRSDCGNAPPVSRVSSGLHGSVLRWAATLTRLRL
jgi:hypothetical protein